MTRCDVDADVAVWWRASQSVHALVEQAVQHLKAQVGDNELTMDQVQALIRSSAGVSGACYQLHVVYAHSSFNLIVWQDGADYVGNRSHVFVDDGDADSRPFPSTVLFFHVDKYVLAVTFLPACRIFVKPRLMRICVWDRFGRWNLGVDATNSYAAQQTLQVLTNLKKTSEAELFSHLYYEK